MKEPISYNPELRAAVDALLTALEQNPELWNVRKEAAHLLFDGGNYGKAAALVWSAPEIPAIDLEIAFAVRVLSRARPERSVRLLRYVLDRNTGSPVKLLALANAFMHYGMVMQAVRFYGAATACDPSLGNGDLEHFMLWLDDSQKLWGAWDEDSQKMDELPWVRRDRKTEEDYAKAMSGLTTPIKVPGLPASPTECLSNQYYRQPPVKDAQITAPPAVTVPLGGVKPEDVIQDEKMGATVVPAQAESAHAPAPSRQTPARQAAVVPVPQVAVRDKGQAPLITPESGKKRKPRLQF